MSDSTSGTMERNTVSLTNSVSASAKDALRAIEKSAGKIGRWTWKFFHELPGHGALLGGTVGLAGVMLIGVAELATACFTAYVTYRVFAYGESFPEAIENSIKFEKGELPKEEVEKPVAEQSLESNHRTRRSSER
jgi:hypothetical protein